MAPHATSDSRAADNGYSSRRQRHLRRLPASHLRRDRFIAVTNDLFGIWRSTDFMAAQLWLIHDVTESSWGEFRSQQGKDGEAAFLRVTGFYNRVGTLITLGIVDERTILRTIGAMAYAGWTKTEPLIKGASAENVTPLREFERLVPICRSVLQLGEPR